MKSSRRSRRFPRRSDHGRRALHRRWQFCAAHVDPNRGAVGQFAVEERKIDVDEWQKKAAAGEITEVFACGTAAVITPVSHVKHTEGEFAIADGEPGEITMALRDTLTGIQRGTFADTHGWMATLS